MKYADDGARIGDLKNMLERIAEVACLFDTDGISIRAINRRGPAKAVARLRECAGYVGVIAYFGAMPFPTTV